MSRSNAALASLWLDAPEPVAPRSAPVPRPVLVTAKAANGVDAVRKLRAWLVEQIAEAEKQHGSHGLVIPDADSALGTAIPEREQRILLRRVGMMGYTLLTGTTPGVDGAAPWWSGNEGAPVRRLREARPDVSPILADLVDELLRPAKEPTRTLPHVVALLDGLHDAITPLSSAVAQRALGRPPRLAGPVRAAIAIAVVGMVSVVALTAWWAQS
jgi:hypothetical protein